MPNTNSENNLKLMKAKFGDDVFGLVSLTALFVRSFHLCPTRFLKKGIPYVEIRDFKKLWNDLPNLQKELPLKDILLTFSNIGGHHFEQHDEFLSYWNAHKRIPYFPRVREIILDVFDEELHPNRLEHAIWEEAATFYGVSFKPVFQLTFAHLAEITNTELSAKKSQVRFTRNHITSTLSQAISREMGDALKKEGISAQFIVRFYLEVLTNLNLLYPVSGPRVDKIPGGPREERIVFKSKINPEYLLVKALGFRTGLVGLDYLLAGGILLPKGGASIVISGPPGTGKSSISLLLSLQIALLGGISLYISLEMDANIALRTLVQFRPKEILQVAFGNDLEKLEKESKFPYSGILHFPPTFESHNIDVFLRDLDRYLQAVPTPKGNRRLLVIDAINIVHSYYSEDTNEVNQNKDKDRPHKPTERDLLTQCIVLAKKYDFSSLFIVERANSYEEDQHEQFVADLYIQTDKGELPGHPTITVIKSRYHPTWQGVSSLSFDNFAGPEIYPESTCISYALRDRGSPKRQRKEPSWADKFPGWKSFLSTGWWLSPSVTALIGPRGALKTAFLDCILSSSSEKIINREASICISLGQEGLPLRPQESSSGLQSTSFRFGTQIDNLGSTSKHVEVFLVFTQRTVRAEQILWCFLTTLTQLLGKGIHTVVCALNDLSKLDNDFPLIDPMGSFLSVFVDICRYYNIDAVIACGSDEESDKQIALHQLERFADNIIVLQTARFGASNINTLHIRRSLSGKHPDDIYEIQPTESGMFGISNQLKLADTISAGKLKYIETEITLYAETLLQLIYINRIKSTFNVQYENAVDVRVLQPDCIDWSLSPPYLLPQRSLRIIQIDGYQMKLETQSIKTNVVQNYVDLSKYSQIQELVKKLRPDLFPEFFQKDKYLKSSMPIGSLSKEIFAVPYYVNPSFLILPKCKLFEDYDENALEMGWEWLLDNAISYKTELASNQSVSPFACPKLTEEDLNTLFLEILFYYVKKCNDNNASRRSARELIDSNNTLVSFLKANQEAVFRTTLMLSQLVSHVKWFDYANESYSEYKLENDTVYRMRMSHLPTDAIFYRSWYCGARQFFDDVSQKAESTKYIVKPLPGNISTRGDWYLTIPSRSAAPEVGVELISNLCGAEAARERLAWGVGLPPHRFFYEDESVNSYPLPVIGLTYEKIDKLLKNSIDRSLFLDYKLAAPKFSYYIEQFSKRWKRYELPATKCYTIDSQEIAEYLKDMKQIWPGFWFGFNNK